MPRWRVAIGTGLLILAFGCGGHGGKGLSGIESAGPAADAFALELLEDSLVGNASLGTLRATVQRELDGEVSVEIHVRQAEQLKALYFDLHYDSERYAPVTVRATGLLDVSGGGLLELASLGEAGTVHHGQVLAHWDQRTGFCGDGVLARVAFRAEPFQPPHTSAAAPDTPNSASVLSLELSTGMLSWDYACAGDYDQNGLVAVSDLTPLGVHFAKTGPFARERIESLVDGDQNGEIHVGDITPIGRNFAAEVAGYNVYFTSRPEILPENQAEDEQAYALNFIDFETGIRDGPDLRITFSAPLPKAAPNGWVWVRPSDGYDLGTSSNVLSVGNGQQPGNQLPVAEFVAAPWSGVAPLDVTFDASTSSDPDGVIVNCEWNWNGYRDGWEWTSTGTELLAAHTYSEAGSYLATVRITDDDGALAFAQQIINVIDDPNEPPTAVLVVDPEEVYERRMVRLRAWDSTDPDGEIVSYAWDLEGDGVFDYEYKYGSFSSEDYPIGSYRPTVRVTDDDGASSLAYAYLTVNDDLNPVVKLTVSPMSGAAPLEVVMDPTGTYDPEDGLQYLWYGIGLDSTYRSFHEEEGLAALLKPVRQTLYLDGTFECILSARDEISQRSSTSVQVAVDGLTVEKILLEDNFGLIDFIDLDFIGSLPCIVIKATGYSEASEDGLIFMRAADETGRQWQPYVELDRDLLFAGGWPDLEIINGKPAVSYYNMRTNRINFIQAIDALGDEWGQPVEVGRNIAAFGGCNDLATIDGLPAVTYGDGSRVYYRRSQDAQGNVWDDALLIDSGQLAGFPLAMMEIDHRPAIAYSVNPDYLKYVLLPGADGAGGLSIQSIELPEFFPGLTMHLYGIEGMPAVVSGNLFIRGKDIEGREWQSPTYFDEPGNISCAPLVVYNQLPVSFRHNFYLLMQMAKNPTGSEWLDVQTIEENTDSYAISAAARESRILLAIAKENPVSEYWEDLYLYILE